MKKVWTDGGWDDYVKIHEDKKLLKKVHELLKDIDRNENTGIGKPEPLVGDLSGYWSRRIDEKNRIVYRIIEVNAEKCIEIIQCGTHYHK